MGCHVAFMRRHAKRALDLLLLGLTAPVYGSIFLVAAGAVLAVDGRPVFFQQRRVGRGGVPFTVWKLRTMTCERDVAARKATSLGHQLRRRGLDELPQFMNVLAGHMSLVGPRPLSLPDTARLGERVAGFHRRLECVPGITGLAQVLGTSTATETLAADLAYAAHRSVAFDAAILACTVVVNAVGKARARPLARGLLRRFIASPGDGAPSSPAATLTHRITSRHG